MTNAFAERQSFEGSWTLEMERFTLDKCPRQAPRYFHRPEIEI